MIRTMPPHPPTGEYKPTPEVGDRIVHKYRYHKFEESRIGVVVLILSTQFIYVTRTGNKHFCQFEEDWKYIKPEKEEKLLNTNKPKTSTGDNMESQQIKRKRSILPPETRIQATGKQPKSLKNIARLEQYQGNQVQDILGNSEINRADIQYDIRHGYAEVVQ